MAGAHTHQLRRIFCLAAMTIWLASGWPVIQKFIAGGSIRDVPVSPFWFIPFGLLGAAVLLQMTLKLRPALVWTALALELAFLVAMTVILPWAGMSQFLVILAWQAANAAGPRGAAAWVAFQTGAVIVALAQAPDPDLCWVIAKALALQLLLVFTAQALRREARTAQALASANRELRSAQALVASTVRDAERLRISRELHDAWGHELTALGLQLEIASHVSEPGRAKDHVLRARALSCDLLAKVRDVVSSLRASEGSDLKDALEALAQGVPAPAVHVQVSPGLRVSPEQAHALVRCAQEAVTNAVRHARATNLWLHVAPCGRGVRLIARDDGSSAPAPSASGSGLIGMRERLECLGGRLAVRTGAGSGFIVDAWLPAQATQPA